MHIDKLQARMERGNQLFSSLKQETDRGRACVGDAIIDEVFKELFRKRLIDDPTEFKEQFSEGRPLGNHGARLRLAFLMGWIGPDTYADCKIIHRVRNKMAHSLDIDRFDHPDVRDVIDNLRSIKDIKILSGETLRILNLSRRQDKITFAVSCILLRCWQLIDESVHADSGVDGSIEPLPAPLTD
jgi:DNA-binding MltR family transcriptional regulator